MNEHEGPVGKAKALHQSQKRQNSQQPRSIRCSSTRRAVTGAPSPENVEDGTVQPKHHKGQVESYRYKLDEKINGKVVEHVVVDTHPYELLTKTCWKMDGAD